MVVPAALTVVACGCDTWHEHEIALLCAINPHRINNKLAQLSAFY